MVVACVGARPTYRTARTVNTFGAAITIDGEVGAAGLVDLYADLIARGEVWNEWRESSEEGGDTGLFVLPLASERLHKQNSSGGAPYGIVLPDGCTDGLFAGERRESFVCYLNRVFEYGGLPRWTG